jgi:uncharacterized membrane protein YqaE (UPF0057 family)
MKTLLAGICGFFLPPLGVLIAGGSVGEFLLNIVLTILGWVPGVIHVFYVILTKK